MRCFRMVLSTLIVLLSASAHGQIQVEKDPAVNPWTHLDFKNDPDDFQFVIMSDHTGGARPGVFKKAVQRVNLLQPEFVMCVGDLISGYIEDAEKLEAQWEEFEGWVDTLEMPFFFAAGNHDIHNTAQLEVWKKRYGRTYYHFVYKNVLFLVMDSEDPPTFNISEEQIAYVTKALDENQDVRWTFLFIHRPAWAYRSKKDLWDRIDSLLQNRAYTVFAGHRHTYIQQTRYGREYYTLATMGGSSSLSGVEAGKFDHVTWVTMADDGPRVANLLLDGIKPGGVRTEYTKSLTDPLLRRRALLTDPVYTRESMFSGGKTAIRILNPGDRPLKAEAGFEVHEDYRPAPRSFELTIPPGEERTIEVAIGIEKSIGLADLAPLYLDWSLQYEFPDREPLRVEGQNRIVAEQLLKVTRSRKRPKVDGHLNDWKNLPLGGAKPSLSGTSFGKPKDLKDASPRFAVAYDDENLYLAIKAADDGPGRGKKPGPKLGILVYIDGRPDPDRSQSQVERGRALNLRLRPDEAFPGPRDRAEDLPKGFEAVCTSNKDGMTAEVSLPVSYLNALQDGRWEAVRINVALHHFGPDAWRGAKKWWRPDWRSRQTYAGSGTFLRR
jgi:hypothetical protein